MVFDDFSPSLPRKKNNLYLTWEERNMCHKFPSFWCFFLKSSFFRALSLFLWLFRVLKHTPTNTHACTPTHTHMHTQSRTHTHAHAHTHTLSRTFSLSLRHAISSTRLQKRINFQIFLWHFLWKRSLTKKLFLHLRIWSQFCIFLKNVHRRRHRRWMLSTLYLTNS